MIKITKIVAYYLQKNKKNGGIIIGKSLVYITEKNRQQQFSLAAC